MHLPGQFSLLSFLTTLLHSSDHPSHPHFPSTPASSDASDTPSSASSASTSTFTLRHSHTHHPTTGQIIFASHPPPAPDIVSSLADDYLELPIKSRRERVWRPRDVGRYQQARFDEGFEASGLDWDEVEVEAPDVTNRLTLLSLAKMTSNAYLESPADKGWYPIDDHNHTTPIGWEPDADALRGHVFANADNSTVILSLKGTSAGLLGNGGPTAKNDRLNDNLLFCCCARVDFSWSTVCDCYRGSGKCARTCVEKALIEESLFYPIALNLYNNLTVIYPHANIWLTGHSLGGGIAGLLGVTFGAPTVSFESPGDRMAAQRLHLPMPPAGKVRALTHVYHTADPIPMGTCTGTLSTCYVAGFALESHCHLGKSIVYDTVNKLKWSVDIRTHSIVQIITRILDKDWNDGEGWENTPPPDDDTAGGGKGDKKRKKLAVPVAEAEDDCVDCFKWDYSDDF